MTAASDLALVRIRTEGLDWIATCRLCGSGMWTDAWASSMEFAHGHLAFAHAGQWKQFCEHEFAAHTTSKSWCLDCGADLRTD